MPQPTPEAWAQIRDDYERTDRPIEDICAEHGISSGTLRDRMRRWRWTRRRPPIPREGPPPPVAAAQAYGIAAGAPLPACGERSAVGAERGRPGEGAHPSPEYGENPPHPISSQKRVEDARNRAYGSEIDLSPQAGRGNQPAAPPAASGANAEADPASIVPRLQSAVARVLPAIEATIARLAAGPHHPREMEQAGRALGALTRTLRELNALLAQHNAQAANAYDDDMPEDIDAFRFDLARRINAFVESRAGDDEEKQ